MKSIWVLLLAAAFLPLASSAQVAQSVAQSPQAQTLAQRPAGITVSATGRVYPTATSARLTLRLGNRTNSLMYDTSVLAPIIDAMVQSGVDRSSIQLPLNFSAPGKSAFATISGTVQHPSTEQMQRGITTVGAAIVAIPGAMLQDVQVTVTAANCDIAQSSARDSAIAAAHAKAVNVAKTLGVKLGGVLNVAATDGLSQDGTCSTSYGITPYGTSMGIDQPSDYVKVTVFSNVTITYAIR